MPELNIEDGGLRGSLIPTLIPPLMPYLELIRLFPPTTATLPVTAHGPLSRELTIGRRSFTNTGDGLIVYTPQSLNTLILLEFYTMVMTPTPIYGHTIVFSDSFTRLNQRQVQLIQEEFINRFLPTFKYSLEFIEGLGPSLTSPTGDTCPLSHSLRLWSTTLPPRTAGLGRSQEHNIRPTRPLIAEPQPVNSPTQGRISARAVRTLTTCVPPVEATFTPKDEIKI